MSRVVTCGFFSQQTPHVTALIIVFWNQQSADVRSSRLCCKFIDEDFVIGRSFVKFSSNYRVIAWSLAQFNMCFSVIVKYEPMHVIHVISIAYLLIPSVGVGE